MPIALHHYISGSRLKTVPRSQIVQYEGDLLGEVYFIKSGYIKIHDIDESSGDEKVLHILGPRAVMPFAFFSGHNVATKWYYTTLTDCELYVLNREELERLMFNTSEVGRFLVNQFSLEVHEILVRLGSMGKSDIPLKLRAVLMYLVVCHGRRLNQTWWRMPFAVNHQLLADMIGVARESAAVSIKQLADVGVIRYPHVGQLEINVTKLEQQDNTKRVASKINGHLSSALPQSSI